MLDTNDKRSFPRMEIECPASFRIDGEAASAGAIVKNLSGGGVLMWIERDLPAGTVMDIEVTPVNNITPPMKAQMKVLRSTPVDGAAGQFAVACTLERILG